MKLRSHCHEQISGETTAFLQLKFKYNNCDPSSISSWKEV